MAKDTLPSILAFLFSEDRKEHPMPPHHTENLLHKIRILLYGSKKGD